MTTYQIFSAAGHDHGIWEAESAEEALVLMHREAGYHCSYDEVEEALMANYRIWISTNKYGAPIVGAHLMGDDTVDSEQIFPSQMAHRCTARTGNGRIMIVTPSAARAAGWDIIDHFPRADGSLGRGY